MNVPVTSAADLGAALEALRGATADTRVLAGGTDLMVEFEIGRTRPDRVVDIWRVDALRQITREDGGLRIGALCSCTDLRADPAVTEHADILVEAAREVGAVQIQNRATLGGNLGTASPAADLNPVLVALGATVRLASARGERDLPVADFLTGYRQTARTPDELIHSIWLPARPAGEHRAFRKIGTRAAQSIAKVVVAVTFTRDDGHFAAVATAAGSVADRTVQLPTLARELQGRRADEGQVRAAVHAAVTTDVHPMDDVRSTARYRRTVLARVLATLLLAS